VTDASRSRRTGGESLLDVVQGLLRELPGLVGDRVELFALELQRAGNALAKAVALTVAAAIVGVTAWLAAWSVIVGLLIAVGWHWAAANALVVLINIAAAAWALWRARALLKLVTLPATRKHLLLGPAREHATPSEPSSDEHRSVPAESAAGAA
jgi:uncharacterized membrane protein YqjE